MPSSIPSRRRPRLRPAFLPSQPLPNLLRPRPCPTPLRRPPCPFTASASATATATATSRPPHRPQSPRLPRVAVAALLALSPFIRPSPASSAVISRPPAQAATAHPSPRLSRATAAPLRLAAPASASRPAAAAAAHGLEGQSFLVAGSAALLASAAAVAVTHPIDTLKTLRQAQHSSRAPGSTTTSTTSAADASVAPTKPPRLSLGALPALYKGVFSNILKEAPNAAIYLATYELFKTFLLRLPVLSAFPLAAMCLAGMLGDAVGSIVRVPAEIVNKRLQLGLSSGWRSAVRDAFLSPNGADATLASWAAVLWRDVPYGGLQIAGYEAARSALASAGLAGLPLGIVAGAGAGLVAAVLTTPADVLVTRMTTQSPQCYLETKRYMSPAATYKRIVREEGFGALWAGALHRGLFYMPMIGLFFAGYESFKYAIVNPSVVGAAGAAVVGAVVAAFRLLVRMSVGKVPVRGRFPLVLAMGHVFGSKKDERSPPIKS